MTDTAMNNMGDFQALCVALVIFLPVVGIVLYRIRMEAYEGFHIFNTHFVPLPEVQEMYNLSALNKSWSSMPRLHLQSWDPNNSGTPPESLLELTVNLLLKSVKKQHALKAEVESLEGEMVTLKLCVLMLTLGFVLMIASHCMLWRRTAESPYKR